MCCRFRIGNRKEPLSVNALAQKVRQVLDSD